jgi:hypothetical protein
MGTIILASGGYKHNPREIRNVPNALFESYKSLEIIEI